MELSGKTCERFWKFVDIRGPDECWEWKGSCVSGKNGRRHGHFKVGGKQKLAHRIAYAMHYGDIRPGMQVNHGCDNPKCVLVTHLHLGTQASNMKEMMERGRGAGQLPPGELHPKAKLREKDVLAIRASKGSCAETAIEFGVTPQNVGMIRLRKTWSHLPDPAPLRSPTASRLNYHFSEASDA